MGRPFDAPIPVYNDFRRVREIDDDAVRDFVTWASANLPRHMRLRVDLLLAEDPLPSTRVVRGARIRLTAQALTLCVVSVRNYAYWAVQASSDALYVDDFFLLLINPELQDDLDTLFSYRQQAEGIAGECQEDQLLEAVRRWMKGRGRESYPGLRTRSIGRTLGYPKGNPLCWHSQEHARLRRRGPRSRPERRAATWATYVVSWLVGSETLAVRLWNKLILPTGYRWGAVSASPAHCLSKYADSKARMIHDLRRTGGQYLVPERPPLRPFPALDTESAAVLESEIERWTRLELARPAGPV